MWGGPKKNFLAGSKKTNWTPPPSKPWRRPWDHAPLIDYYSGCYSRLVPVLCEIDQFYSSHLSTVDDDSYLLRSDLDDLKLMAIQVIESIYSQIVFTMAQTAEAVIPKTNPTTLKEWWDEELNSLKSAAMESNKQWISAGRPKTGPLADIRKNDKYAYKLAILKHKREQNDNISETLLDSLGDRDSNTFWKIWKSKMGTGNPQPKIVNGKTDDNEIAYCFAEYFSSACSSNSEERNCQLRKEYCTLRKNYSCCDNIKNYLVSIELVDASIFKLKTGKAASLDRLTSEHLKHCHPIIVMILTKLFNLMLLFEYVPDSFGKSILVPIPKLDSCSAKVSVDDYRGISLTPVISKVFELCLLKLFDKCLLSSESMQFGFKAKSGCNKALYAVRKTIEFFIERESTVNLCALDLSKAFDKLNKYALFIKLMNKKCPITLISILECWYDKNSACVKWGTYFSPFVKLRTGTRQGSVISPYLFAIFINDVLVKLQKSALGCHISSLCFNAFMFADDLLLAAISLTDLQRMISIVKSELDWLDMTINVKKSMCMRIGKRFDVTTSDISIDDKPIAWVKEIRYLGMYIVAGNTFKCNLHCAKVKFFRSLNGILSKLGPTPPPRIVLFLTSSYCNPALFYGLESLRLSKTNYNSISYAYNASYSKLFSTFDKTVLALCQFYSGELPSSHAVDLRTLNFYAALDDGSSKPANILFRLYGKQEQIDLYAKYNIDLDESVKTCCYKRYVQNAFNELCFTLM